jgi:hypothetical protein
MGGMFMNTAGITAALPAQELDRAKNFYVEKVGLQALESPFSRQAMARSA